MEAPGIEPIANIEVLRRPVSVSEGLSPTHTPGEWAGIGVDGGFSAPDCGSCGSPTEKAIREALEALDRGRLDIARDLLRSILTSQGEVERGEHE